MECVRDNKKFEHVKSIDEIARDDTISLFDEPIEGIGRGIMVHDRVTLQDFDEYSHDLAYDISISKDSHYLHSALNLELEGIALKLDSEGRFIPATNGYLTRATHRDFPKSGKRYNLVLFNQDKNKKEKYSNDDATVKIINILAMQLRTALNQAKTIPQDQVIKKNFDETLAPSLIGYVKDPKSGLYFKNDNKPIVPGFTGIIGYATPLK